MRDTICFIKQVGQGESQLQDEICRKTEKKVGSHDQGGSVG